LLDATLDVNKVGRDSSSFVWANHCRCF
jgi:hypothetical protein